MPAVYLCSPKAEMPEIDTFEMLRLCSCAPTSISSVRTLPKPNPLSFTVLTFLDASTVRCLIPRTDRRLCGASLEVMPWFRLKPVATPAEGELLSSNRSRCCSFHGRWRSLCQSCCCFHVRNVRYYVQLTFRKRRRESCTGHSALES